MRNVGMHPHGSGECGLFKTVSQIVEHGAAMLDIHLPDGSLAIFDTYYEVLERCGENVNLTAVKGAEDVARLHFLDSIAILKAADFKNARVIDIGSGAGFPGVPVKVVEKSSDVTLLDSTGKRVDFLINLCAELGVAVRCIHARAEELAHAFDMRESFDISVSRAVAKLNILCELCLPFVAVGGSFLAMKSVDSQQELEEAGSAISALGARFEKSVDYTIPDTDITHRVIIIRKISPTPEKYPRRYAKILKQPI